MTRTDAKAVYTDPADFAPPVPWRRFYVRLIRPTGRSTRAVGSLTNAELAWVARSVAAELNRRQDRKEGP